MISREDSWDHNCTRRNFRHSCMTLRYNICLFIYNPETNSWFQLTLRPIQKYFVLSSGANNLSVTKVVISSLNISRRTPFLVLLQMFSAAALLMFIRKAHMVTPYALFWQVLAVGKKEKRQQWNSFYSLNDFFFSAFVGVCFVMRGLS